MLYLYWRSVPYNSEDTSVEYYRLTIGLNFLTKNMLLICIAEESNLCHIPMFIIPSDNCLLQVVGDCKDHAVINLEGLQLRWFAA
jgi:hypothetical protein